MLGAFDAAGHESDQPFLVVAGFVSSAGDWDDFSQRWLERLEQDDLPYFHGNNFASCTGIFKDWGGPDNAERRHRLSSDLMVLIVSHAYRYFVQGVRPEDFNAAFTEKERDTFNINAYALCGRSCVAELGRWMRGDSLQWDRTRAPDLVFEDGDIGKGKLRDMLIRHHYPEPQFRPGKKVKHTTLGDIHPYVPLQAADWLAYEAFRLLKSGTYNREQWRWPIREFCKMPGFLGFASHSGLLDAKDDIEALDREVKPLIVLAHPFSDGRFVP